MSEKEQVAGDSRVAPSQWERSVLENLIDSTLAEQRRARKWNTFFKLVLLFFLIGYLAIIVWIREPEIWEIFEENNTKHTALVDVFGVIAAGEAASASNIIEGLQAAFEDENTKGVVLRINTPGGSPVQASYIYREIKRLREEHKDIPVYAVIQDIGASGGYYVAVGADEIYVNESSIVGSIGVRIDNFGFVDTLKIIGAERRLLTAGEHKAVMDPFLPWKEEDKAHVQQVLDELHEEFIAVVKEGRADRLGEDPQLFSGLFWSGKKAIELGLADGIKSVDDVARDLIEAEDTVNFTPKESVLDRLVSRVGASIAKEIKLQLQSSESIQLR